MFIGVYMKKALKIITSITCGLGIISTIPFVSTSCAKNEEIPQKLQVVYDHINYKGDYKIDGFSGDQYGIDLPEDQLTGTNLISVCLYDKLTDETAKIDINDVKFDVIDLNSKTKLDWIWVKPISVDSSKARIYWDSTNINEGTYEFYIEAKYQNFEAKIDNNFQLNLASPDSSKIRISFNSDNNYNTTVAGGSTLTDKISLNSKSLKSPDIKWNIEEIIGPNALNANEQIFSDWISIDKSGQITIQPSSAKKQKIANNNYCFRISAWDGSDLTSTSNYIYLQVSVDWKNNFVSKCYLDYSSTTLNGFKQWYLDNVSLFSYNTLCIPTDVTAIADSAFNGPLKMPDNINSLFFFDDGTNETREITIDKLAFAHNPYLNNVQIPKYVKEIGDRAFAQTNLKKIDLDNTNPYFSYSSKLVSAVEKNNCHAIYHRGEDFGTGSIVGNLICGCPCVDLAKSAVGKQYFIECYGITGVILLNTLNQIENYAFYRCVNLSKIIWRNISSIDDIKINQYSFIKIPSKGLLIAGNRYCPCNEIFSKLVEFASFPST